MSSDLIRQHFWWLVIFAGLALYLSWGVTWPGWLATVPLAGLITWILSRQDRETMRR
jgi:hypothetical protein